MKTKQDLKAEARDFIADKTTLLPTNKVYFIAPEEMEEMLADFASQYSTPQEGRGRYVTDDQIVVHFQQKYLESIGLAEKGGMDSSVRMLKKEMDKEIETAKWMRDQIFTSPPDEK